VVRNEILSGDLAQTGAGPRPGQATPGAQAKERPVLVRPDAVRPPDVAAEHAKAATADVAFGLSVVQRQDAESTKKRAIPGTKLGEDVVGAIAPTAGAGPADRAGVARMAVTGRLRPG